MRGLSAATGWRSSANLETCRPLNVEKHKILQILVNLLRNAKYACQDSERADKRLTVRVANGEGRIKISVIDNGVGIPPENLTRIFNHGFTTRKDGHGFGLHSGALAAKEMGGSLTRSQRRPRPGRRLHPGIAFARLGRIPMNNMPADTNRRVLVIDDNAAIHDDFRKILSPRSAAALEATEAAVFGPAPDAVRQARFEVDSAYQGPEGLLMVTEAP